MMPDEYEHLQIRRLEPVNARRKGGRFPGIEPPENLIEHARGLQRQVQTVVESSKVEEPGFDPRLLLKIDAPLVKPEDFESIEGLRVVSQEQKSLLVLFASEEGLAEFKRRLDEVANGRTPVRKEILYAIKGIDGWSKEDRIGPAIRKEGYPGDQAFIVDAELWAIESWQERNQMLRYFEQWCLSHNIEKIDRLNQDAIVMYRLKVTADSLAKLLNLRDVRMVDLPPSYQLELSMVHTSISHLPQITSPSDDAPGIVVLDDGVVSSHPLLESAFGDGQSFIAGADSADYGEHGTKVAGFALYGDLTQCLEQGQLTPRLRLFSGKITDPKVIQAGGFIENYISAAVRYFTDNYGCKVFNLSFGDTRKPYLGGHVRSLATVLDTLSREYRVLFVVSAGNYAGTEDRPQDWLHEYPDYLFLDDAKIIDPAPALNALTVGSLARFEVNREAQRYTSDPAYQPIARKNQPSPFSRTGPGPGGAIKPDVVEYGGNFSVDARRGMQQVNTATDGLGEIATLSTFAQGTLFTIDRGTSYSAPKVAHMAARILTVYPQATPELMRALIVAHSKWPSATVDLFGGDEDKILQSVGYGVPDMESVLYSTEKRVTLISEEMIAGETHHFYEVPLPTDFFSPGRRPRSLRVALAHTPMVRRTRIVYKASTIDFRVVREVSIDRVVNVFRQASRDEREDIIQELNGLRPKRAIRSKGTVQAATVTFQQLNGNWEEKKIFIVVTRKVEPWAANIFDSEPYALVAVLSEESNQQVRYYTQIRQMLRTRVRL
ncbi:S8 family peptidase [Alicyclobacillus suci]|uniref:S8 family peptidase n=1 Tax=Alicyclobacillus suci TaxID=2816080 RepID=UPI001A8F0016|nr:S8 family peptidase [Alicyclobacillus suci]